MLEEIIEIKESLMNITDTMMEELYDEDILVFCHVTGIPFDKANELRERIIELQNCIYSVFPPPEPIDSPF